MLFGCSGHSIPECGQTLYHRHLSITDSSKHISVIQPLRMSNLCEDCEVSNDYPCTEHVDLILNILYTNQFKKLNEWYLVVHTALWHIQHGPRDVHRQSLEACLPLYFWVHASLLSLLPPEMNKVKQISWNTYDKMPHKQITTAYKENALNFLI